MVSLVEGIRCSGYQTYERAQSVLNPLTRKVSEVWNKIKESFTAVVSVASTLLFRVRIFFSSCFTTVTRTISESYERRVFENSLRKTMDDRTFQLQYAQLQARLTAQYAQLRSGYGARVGDNKELALAVIHQREKQFQNLSETLKNDRGFVLEAVQGNGQVLQFVKMEFRNDREIV